MDNLDPEIKEEPLGGAINRLQHYFSDHWPKMPDSADKPTPEGQQAGGFMFSGVIQETVPKRLLLDNRLTPLERNAWMAFKLMLSKEGFAAPRYQD